MSNQPALNFSTRQNKSIERSLVFESLETLKGQGLLNDVKYVGFGSVWFVDFQMAQRSLEPIQMVSIERDSDLIPRARFNRPFKNISISEGDARFVIPDLLSLDDGRCESWVVWLDYDGKLTEDELSTLLDTAQSLPPKSVLLTTFNRRRKSYWKGHDSGTVHEKLNEIFGDSLSSHVKADEVNTLVKLTDKLADLVHQSIATRLNDFGGHRYLPAFQLPYSDGQADMLTVGGYIAGQSEFQRAKNLLKGGSWPGSVSGAIDFDPLTAREVMELRRFLPSEDKLKSAVVKKDTGIDLSEAALEGFREHYRRFPVYSDISASI